MELAEQGATATSMVIQIARLTVYESTRSTGWKETFTWSWSTKKL
jgi:hypothetical protein